VVNLSDTIVLSHTDDTHAVTLQGVKVSYNVNKAYDVDVGIPTFSTAQTGTTDGTTTDKLVNSGASFSDDGIVKKGMIVKNTTDNTYTLIEAVDSNSTLSLVDDIFVSGEGYEIWVNAIREVMDTKKEDVAIQIQGHLIGDDTTEQFLQLIGLTHNSDGDPLKLKWRGMTFLDIWVKSIKITDALSLTSTPDGFSKSLNSSQVDSDTATFGIQVLLLRGNKLGD